MLTLSIAALASLASMLMFFAIRQLLIEPPKEDRTFKDRPPIFFRVLWLPIYVAAYNADPLLTKNYKRQQEKKLTAAGLNFALNAEQFFGAKLVACVMSLAVLCIVFSPMGSPPMSFLAVGALLGFCYPDLWLRDQRLRRQRKVLRSFPFYLDIMSLSLEAGMNVNAALQQAVDKSPEGPLRVEFGRVLRDVRSGRTRAEAFQEFAARVQLPAVTNWVSAVVHAEKQGANLSPLLRAQAQQRRVERFQHAEKLAMEAPVKMLGPLILCIMPCTFVIIAFPIAVKFMTQGML
jgi:tight adherence protein C